MPRQYATRPERQKALREAFGRVRQGDLTPQEPGLYFESVEELRQVLTDRSPQCSFCRSQRQGNAPTFGIRDKGWLVFYASPAVEWTRSAARVSSQMCRDQPYCESPHLWLAEEPVTGQAC